MRARSDWWASHPGNGIRTFSTKKSPGKEGAGQEGCGRRGQHQPASKAQPAAGDSTEGHHSFPDRECFLKSVVKVQTSHSAPLKQNAACNTDSSKPARLPLQETSDNSRCLPSARQLHTHPDPSSLPSGDAKASAFSRHGSLLTATPFRSLAARKRGGKKPPLPRSLLCPPLVCSSGQQNTSERSPSSSRPPPVVTTPLPESPAHWQELSQAVASRKRTGRLPHRHSAFLSRHAQASLQSRYSASPRSIHIRSYFCRTWPHTFSFSNSSAWASQSIFFKKKKKKRLY